MKRFLRMTALLLLALALSAGIIAAAMGLKRWLQIDACLDAGGRWSYEHNRCEFTDDAAANPATEKGVEGTNEKDDRGRLEKR